MRIFAIDPGTNITGFCFLVSEKSIPTHPRDFVIEDIGSLECSKKLPLWQRIGQLYKAIDSLLLETKPHFCVIEKAFVGKNAQSALKLGQARGAFMAAAYQRQIPVEELAPTHIKKTITGKGSATKEDVQFALKTLINFNKENLPSDAADALAIGLTFGMNYSFAMRILK